MALCTLAEVKLPLGIAVSTYDSLLQMCLDTADQSIRDYCKKNFEQTSYTHYYDGHALQDLTLRQRPVISVTSVYLDQKGGYGQGPGAFGASTLLSPGSDYLLVIDDKTGNYSQSGILRRTNLGSSSSLPLTWSGTLSGGSNTAFWPRGSGNIKVVYVAGYATVPAPVKHACAFLAGRLYLGAGKQGQLASSESLGSYSYSLMNDHGGKYPELATMRQLLSPYREVAF